MTLDSCECELLKPLQNKVTEIKQVAEPQAKQEQIAAVSFPEVGTSEAPAPRRRGGMQKSEESVAPVAS
jgi:hypothetical protein